MEVRPLKNIAPRIVPLETVTAWDADNRLLPPHLRFCDNTRRIKNYKRALKNALSTRITPLQREQIMLFYDKGLTKTQIGKRYGVGSSTVCKTLKAAEQNIKEYVELYMQIYDLLDQELLREDELF